MFQQKQKQMKRIIFILVVAILAAAVLAPVYHVCGTNSGLKITAAVLTFYYMFFKTVISLTKK